MFDRLIRRKSITTIQGPAREKNKGGEMIFLRRGKKRQLRQKK